MQQKVAMYESLLRCKFRHCLWYLLHARRNAGHTTDHACACFLGTLCDDQRKSRIITKCLHMVRTYSFQAALEYSGSIPQMILLCTVVVLPNVHRAPSQVQKPALPDL